jgi:hypothetical protein
MVEDVNVEQPPGGQGLGCQVQVFGPLSAPLADDGRW